MLEEHIPSFLDFLREQRYARVSIQICRIAAGEFCLYVGDRVSHPEEISLRHREGYLDLRARIFPHLWRRPMPPQYRERLTGALTLFLRYLDRQGLRTGIPISKPQDLRAVPGYESTLGAFECFLREHRGLSPRTIETYVDHASRLCRYMVKSDTASWDDLSAQALYAHLRHQAHRLQHLSFKNAQTALRAFFRFLRLTERCRKELDAYLVTYRTYTLSRVPVTVSVDDLHRVFDDVRDDTPANLRDRAVLLLLTLYGLRIGEVARLGMDDVRWREQQIVIRPRKAGKDLVLPLHPAAARVLLDYVDRARPRGTPFREVFLTRRRPRPYPAGSNLGMTLRGRLDKLGLRFHPHALRHTLASQLINHDCPPEWIQILLGHARFESTRIYAKVDLAHLREVADQDFLDP